MSASVELWEVIADHPDFRDGTAFGVTFHDHATACAYARHLRRLGYSAKPSPMFCTEATLAAALQSAASFFDDPRIKEA